MYGEGRCTESVAERGGVPWKTGKCCGGEVIGYCKNTGLSRSYPYQRYGMRGGPRALVGTKLCEDYFCLLVEGSGIHSSFLGFSKVPKSCNGDIRTLEERLAITACSINMGP